MSIGVKPESKEELKISVQPEQPSIPETPKVEEQPKPENAQELENFAKQTARLKKAIQKVSSKIEAADKQLPAIKGVEIKAIGRDSSSKMRVQQRLQNLITGLQELHEKATEKLNRNEPIDSEEIEQLKKAQTELEQTDDVSTQENKKDEEQEYTAIVLLGKSIHNAAERTSRETENGESDYDQKVDLIIEKIAPEDAEGDETDEDLKAEWRRLEELKESFKQLLLESGVDSAYVEDFFNRPEFSHVKRAYSKGAIEISDISEAEIREIVEEFKKESSTDAPEDAFEITNGGEQEGLLAELLGEEGSGIRESLKEVTDTISSHKYSAVRTRCELASTMLDELVSRTNIADSATEENVDELFRQLSLDIDEVPEEYRRNYENAVILRDSYKRMLRERNEEILAQQKIRLDAVRDKISDQGLDSDLEDETLSSIEKAKKINSAITSEIKTEADNALKTYFLEDILRRQGIEDIDYLNTDNVQMVFDEESGYYMLRVRTREDFNKIIGVGDDSDVVGAAYKFNSLYIILDEIDPETGSAKQDETDLLALARHEVTHLVFDDIRKTNLEREKIFHATKILNLLIKTQELSPEDREVLLEKIIAHLGKTQADRVTDAEENLSSDSLLIHITDSYNQDIQDLVDGKVGEVNAQVHLDRRSKATKIARILKSYDKRVAEIDTESNENKNSAFFVKELTAEIYTTLTEPGSKLTLAAIGIGQGEELEYKRESSESEGKPDFIVHNIEAANMIRILNLASTKIDPEKRQEFITKWTTRIMSSGEFNQTNTLSFIFELEHTDGIKLFEDEEPGNALEKSEDEEKYLEISKRYKDGDFKTLIRTMLSNGSFPQFDKLPPEELQKALDRVFAMYSEIINFDFSDIASDKARATENPYFDFASRPMTDALVAMLNDANRIQYPFSHAWLGGINMFMEGLGLKRKDMAERGILPFWGKDDEGKYRLLWSGQSTTPIKPSANYPFGWGEIKKDFFGRRNEFFMNDPHYTDRLGVSELSMDIKEMFALLQDGIASRLQETYLYARKEQIYLILDRIGLAYFHDGQIDPSYRGLTRQIDSYLASHLYVETDANGKIKTGGRVSEMGLQIYNGLVANGYSGRDLHLLMEAHNNIQKLILSSGEEKTIDVKDFPITQGIMTQRLAERTKMMRTGSPNHKKEKEMKAYIEQGERFDEISRFLMELHWDSYQAALSTGKSKEQMELYTMENVIKAIEQVDNINPNVEGETDTLASWRKKKGVVKLSFGDKSREFSRADLKEYVRCFFYAKAYEAMATGVYGDERVVKLGESYYEIKDASGISDEEDSQERIRNFLNAFTFTDEEIGEKYDHSKDDSAKSWDKLSKEEKTEFKKQLIQENIQKVARTLGLITIEKDSDSIPKEIKDSINKDGEGELRTYKKYGKDIYIRLPGAYVSQRIEAHTGVKKSDMITEFGEFKHHDEGDDPNAYALPDIKGKLINKVEDVIWEKARVNEAYFYFQTLMQQAENYRMAVSKNKEKWIGIGRVTMLLRWLQTGLTIVALTGLTPVMAGILLNPWMIGALLANFFIIGNWMARNAELYGKRKISAIKATNELKQLEPRFEQAFFDPKFSLGPERKRLLQLCKTAEDILKAALVTTVETPKNVLEEVTKGLVEEGKKIAQG